MIWSIYKCEITWPKKIFWPCLKWTVIMRECIERKSRNKKNNNRKKSRRSTEKSRKAKKLKILFKMRWKVLIKVSQTFNRNIRLSPIKKIQRKISRRPKKKLVKGKKGFKKPRKWKGSLYKERRRKNKISQKCSGSKKSRKKKKKKRRKMLRLIVNKKLGRKRKKSNLTLYLKR